MTSPTCAPGSHHRSSHSDKRWGSQEPLLSLLQECYRMPNHLKEKAIYLRNTAAAAFHHLCPHDPFIYDVDQQKQFGGPGIPFCILGDTGEPQSELCKDYCPVAGMGIATYRTRHSRTAPPSCRRSSAAPSQGSPG